MENYSSSKYKPLSPWAYFFYQILFSIPVVGFIFLIVFSISGANINRRNFARSYWCALALMLILIIILSVLGVGAGLLDKITSIGYGDVWSGILN